MVFEESGVRLDLHGWRIRITNSCYDALEIAALSWLSRFEDR